MLFARSGISVDVNGRAMLITFVQSVIGPFDKDFSPLDERRGEKCGNRAENDLLEKSRPHLHLKKQR
jgi:hypothetical protein